MYFRKKHLSAHTTTGLKANLQILPWYEISYHVVRNRQSEQPIIKCIYRLENTKQNQQKIIIEKYKKHKEKQLKNPTIGTGRKN